MIKQLIVQALNGFSVKDLPYLVLQLSVSCFLAIIIRYYWRRTHLSAEESSFLKYLIPLQVVYTTMAIFAHQSPWMVILFGLLALIPFIGSSSLTLKSKVFSLICIFIAFGCGAANLVVTGLVVVLLVIPSLHFYRSSE